MRLDTVRRYLGGHVSRIAVGHTAAEDVHARLGEPDLHLLDCNLEFGWRAGHLPGARYVGYDDLNPAVLPANRHATLVFYCGSSL
jgi:hypothetical protein